MTHDHSDLIDRLKKSCVGQPALIPWPHRLLHEAIDAIALLAANTATDDATVARVARAILKARFYDYEPEQYGHDLADFYLAVWPDWGDEAIVEANAAIAALGGKDE